MSDYPDIVERLRGCIECVDGFPYARIPPHELLVAADEIKRLRSDLKAATDDREACLTFLRTEMHWEEFREEFFANTASGENARKLVAFLRRFERPKAGGDEVVI